MLAQAEAPRRFSTLPDSLPSKVISACPALPREFGDFSGPLFREARREKKKRLPSPFSEIPHPLQSEARMAGICLWTPSHCHCLPPYRAEQD